MEFWMKSRNVTFIDNYSFVLYKKFQQRQSAHVRESTAHTCTVLNTFYCARCPVHTPPESGTRVTVQYQLLTSRCIVGQF